MGFFMKSFVSAPPVAARAGIVPRLGPAAEADATKSAFKPTDRKAGQRRAGRGAIRAP
jgi:hypothetical protein